MLLGDGVGVAASARRSSAARAGPRRDAQHLGGEDLGGRQVGLHHVDRPPDVRGVDPLAALEVGDELVEELADPARVGTLDRDLVAPHVDRGVVERPLDEAEELVPFAEQPDHELVAGDLDLDLGRGHVYRPEGTSGPRGTRGEHLPAPAAPKPPGWIPCSVAGLACRLGVEVLEAAGRDPCSIRRTPRRPAGGGG